MLSKLRWKYTEENAVSDGSFAGSAILLVDRTNIRQEFFKASEFW